MVGPSPVPRLTDIVEAIALLRAEIADVTLSRFTADIRRRWIVERGIEIVSEASRRLPEELKLRHAERPWRKVAGIGNVLRHNYETVSPPLLWALVRDEFPALQQICLKELADARAQEHGERS